MITATCTSCGASIPPDAAFCPHCAHPTGRTPGMTGGLAGTLQEALGPGYEVRGLVGQGGFAQVFEVWDRDLQRRLAVKVLRPDIAWTESMLDRFREEARALARLAHPNILPIHFVGSGGGLTWYAMPFVEGQTLGELLRLQGALPVDRAVAILRPVLDALAYAHRQGLVHRDIKPDNIQIEQGTGRILLLDFGIAKQLDREGGLTQAGVTIGSPLYMSPEQALGRGDIDHRSDIYAVGALLYHVVTGAPPFEGSTSQEIVGKHIGEPAPRPSTMNAQIPAWLSQVILRCLEKTPEDRYQSVDLLRDALQQGRASGPQDPVSTEVIARRLDADAPTVALDAPPPRRHSRAAWLVAALVVVVLAVALFQWSRPRLVLANPMVDPVTVRVNGREATLPAGGRSRFVVRRGRPAIVEWSLVPRRLANGDRVGVPVEGEVTVDRPPRRLVLDLIPRDGDRAWFAPLITNATDGPLTMTVNAGSAAAQDCGCQVAPGATRQPIGYYPLFSNSSVEARDRQGRTARFTGLGPKVTDQGGAVGLRFTEADFRP